MALDIFPLVLSAIAAGPCFTILCTKLTEFLSRKKLVPDTAVQTLAKISAYLTGLYVLLKIIDTLVWAYKLTPKAGLTLMDYYREGPYGIWLLIAEVIIFGVIPAIILLTPKARQNQGWLVTACLMNCTGIVLNRFVFTVVSLAIPVMPFDRFVSYWPTWQEWGIALALVGYGFLLFSVSYRYLPLFPKERELNP